MNDPTVLLVVAAALVDGDGRVLVQQRPPGKSLAGLWEFPGGKLEPGETPEAALVRELAEELGVSVDADALVPLAFASEPLSGKHLVLLLYTCTAWQGEARALEASQIRWCTPDELQDLDMPPADAPFIGTLRTALRGAAHPSRVE